MEPQRGGKKFSGLPRHSECAPTRAGDRREAGRAGGARAARALPQLRRGPGSSGWVGAAAGQRQGIRPFLVKPVGRKSDGCAPPKSQLLSVCRVPGCQVRIRERPQVLEGRVQGLLWLDWRHLSGLILSRDPCSSCLLCCDALSSGDVIGSEGLRTREARFSKSSVAGRSSWAAAIAIRASFLYGVGHTVGLWAAKCEVN